MALTNGQTRKTFANHMCQACKILHSDYYCGGLMEYIEHLAWLLFLRFLDAQEEIWQTEAALECKTYQRILEGDLAWAYWARKDWPADDLIQFVHTHLIPSLQSLHSDPFHETIYDPACDLGGVLAAAFDYIRSRHLERTIEQDAFLQTQTLYAIPDRRQFVRVWVTNRADSNIRWALRILSNNCKSNIENQVLLQAVELAIEEMEEKLGYEQFNYPAANWLRWADTNKKDYLESSYELYLNKQSGS